MTRSRNRISTVKIFRRAVQLAGFILFPGLFLSIYGALRDVYTALISGTFSAAALSWQLWVLAATIPLTVLMGRFFCGFICSFGAMGDLFWFISGKLMKKRPRIGDSIDKALKGLKYLILLFIVIFIWTLGAVSFDTASSPWNIFGMYASLNGWPSENYLLSLGGGLLLLIIIGSMLVERFFCRYLCPLGAVFAPISRIRFFRFKKPRQNCGSCSLCSKNCSMGIPLYRSDYVTSGECIGCLACKEACPKGNVTAKPAPSVGAALTVAAITGLYYAGNIVTQEAYAAGNTFSADAMLSQGQYADGVYTGSASGYRGSTQVEVTVSNGNIQDIEIISTDDDREYINRAAAVVISSILNAQSTEVDTVSGATYSSYAVINAVADALGLEDSGSIQVTVPEGIPAQDGTGKGQHKGEGSGEKD